MFCIVTGVVGTGIPLSIKAAVFITCKLVFNLKTANKEAEEKGKWGSLRPRRNDKREMRNEEDVVSEGNQKFGMRILYVIQMAHLHTAHLKPT